MISLTYDQLSPIDETAARRMLLRVYHDSAGSVSHTVRELSCSSVFPDSLGSMLTWARIPT